MSKNIQASLIRYNGDIGPTILDVDDKTEGPDGTTKPLTKDMLQQMIVANFPELQNVKDADVKTELELIKQQQLEILQRLNQPIDTQLSGSNIAQPTDLQYHALEDEEALPQRLTSRLTKFEQLYEREVRTSNSDYVVITPPEGARGLLLTLSARYNNISGTFEEGEGMALEAGTLPTNSLTHLGSIFSITTDFTTTGNNFGHASILFYPGADKMDADVVDGSNKIVGVPPFPKIRTRMLITGTFEEGEGIDTELVAEWLM